MKKRLFPLEVPFRVFVAITFAGTITFHIIGLGIHTYIGQKKNALVDRIEALAETRSRLLGIETALSVLKERLRSARREDSHNHLDLGLLLPQIRIMTLLLKNDEQFDQKKDGTLLESWNRTAGSLAQCRKNVGSDVSNCVEKVTRRLSVFDRHLLKVKNNVALDLLHVERFQSKLEHWDTVLYWMTTVLGLLFMALGWRNVVLQVGNPIKDVANYLETLQEGDSSRSSSVPALFSIRELRILKENMKNVHSDELTGLLTREAIKTMLKKAIREADQKGTYLSICLFDIDCFRKFNEKYGHETGDLVLKHVATMVNKSIRPKDCCGRWGEEEFLIILPGLVPEKVLADLEVLRSRIGNPFEIGFGNSLHVTVSGGFVSFVRGEQVDDILMEAGRALDHSKKQGGDRISAVFS